MLQHNEMPYLSPAHFEAFGRIISAFARAEVVFTAALQAAFRLEGWEIDILLATFTFEQKTRLLTTLVEQGDQPDIFKRALKIHVQLISRKAELRNYVAHSAWTPGQRRESIRPSLARARSRTTDGSDRAARDWTPAELTGEAVKITERAEDLKQLLQRQGMFPASSHG